LFGCRYLINISKLPRTAFKKNSHSQARYSNRRLDNKFNIFEGITRNWFFIGINVVMVGGQVMIMFVGGEAFQITSLNGVAWAISIILGAISIPVAVIIRLIPDQLVAKLLPSWMSRKKTDPVYVSIEDRFEWNRGIEEIREELSFLKMVRGGRLNQLKFRRRNLREAMKENFSHMFRTTGSKSDMPITPIAEDNNTFPPSSPGSQKRRRSRSNSAFAAAAMVPSIIAGSIGGWSPVEKTPSRDGDAPPFNPTSQHGLQVHSATTQNDSLPPESESTQQGASTSQSQVKS
jgi:Ca2+-transporting ATPase